MKRTLILMLVTLLALSLVACDKGTTDTDTTAATEEITTAAPTEAPTEEDTTEEPAERPKVKAPAIEMYDREGNLINKADSVCYIKRWRS